MTNSSYNRTFRRNRYASRYQEALNRFAKITLPEVMAKREGRRLRTAGALVIVVLAAGVLSWVGLDLMRPVPGAEAMDVVAYDSLRWGYKSKALPLLGVLLGGLVAWAGVGHVWFKRQKQKRQQEIKEVGRQAWQKQVAQFETTFGDRLKGWAISKGEFLRKRRPWIVGFGLALLIQAVIMLLGQSLGAWLTGALPRQVTRPFDRELLGITALVVPVAALLGVVFASLSYVVTLRAHYMMKDLEEVWALLLQEETT